MLYVTKDVDSFKVFQSPVISLIYIIMGMHEYGLFVVVSFQS